MENELYTERSLNKKLQEQLRELIAKKDEEVKSYKKMVFLYQEQLKAEEWKYKTQSVLEKLLWFVIGYAIARAVR